MICDRLQLKTSPLHRKNSTMLRRRLASSVQNHLKSLNSTDLTRLFYDFIWNGGGGELIIRRITLCKPLGQHGFNMVDINVFIDSSMVNINVFINSSKVTWV